MLIVKKLVIEIGNKPKCISCQRIVVEGEAEG